MKSTTMLSVKWIVIIFSLFLGGCLSVRFFLKLAVHSVDEQYIINMHRDSVITLIRHHKSAHRNMDWKRMERESVIENSTHDTIIPFLDWYDFNFYYELRLDGQRCVYHGCIDMRDSIPTTIRMNGVMYLQEGREWGGWRNINDSRDLTWSENTRHLQEYETQVLDSIGLKWTKNFLEDIMQNILFW